jgi:hypothetical protein
VGRSASGGGRTRPVGAGRPHALPRCLIVVVVGQVVIVILVQAVAVGRIGLVGFFGEVPAFGALLHPQHPRFVPTRRADALTCGAARDGHDLIGTGLPVQDPAQQGPAADPLRGSDLTGLPGGDGEVQLRHAASSSISDSAANGRQPAASIRMWSSVTWAKRTRIGSGTPSIST